MQLTASRRGVIVLTTMLLTLMALIPAKAPAASSHHRRHHRRAHTTRRRHHHRRAWRRSGGSAAQRSGPAAQDACANSASSARTSSFGTMRAAVVCEINLQRAAHRLPRLAESAALDNSAQGWSRVMVATQQFSHGASFSARISAAGYPWGSAAENIATGYPTPRAVVAAWMASLGHCRNILNPTFRDVGVGEVPAPVGGGGPATWTGDFGLRLLASPAASDWGPAGGCPY